MLNNFIKEGMQDGSIRDSLNLEETSLFIIEMIMSLMQRLAFRGKLLQEEHGVDVRAIAGTSRAFVLQYLQK
ncbi:hypothetical protein D3C73_1035850 [compost metagenome]